MFLELLLAIWMELLGALGLALIVTVTKVLYFEHKFRTMRYPGIQHPDFEMQRVETPLGTLVYEQTYRWNPWKLWVNNWYLFLYDQIKFSLLFSGTVLVWGVAMTHEYAAVVLTEFLKMFLPVAACIMLTVPVFAVIRAIVYENQFRNHKYPGTSSIDLDGDYIATPVGKLVYFYTLDRNVWRLWCMNWKKLLKGEFSYLKRALIVNFVLSALVAWVPFL